MPSDEPGGSAPDPDPVDLDPIPAGGHDHRPREPRARLARTRSHAREPVETAGQKAAEVGEHRADDRLFGVANDAELIGVEPGLVDVFGVALVEQSSRQLAVPDPGREHAQGSAEHRPAQVRLHAAQVEANGLFLQAWLDLVPEWKEPTEGFGGGSRDATFSRSEAVVVED